MADAPHDALERTAVTFWSPTDLMRSLTMTHLRGGWPTPVPTKCLRAQTPLPAAQGAAAESEGRRDVRRVLRSTEYVLI